MPVLPVSHFNWQVLRAAKRSKKPVSGKQLRVSPTRQSKDGSFLNQLVDSGLLGRASGSAAAPFEATYVLTPLGEHAAEYGEYERTFTPTAEPDAATKSRKRPK